MQKDHRIRLEITNNSPSIFTFEQAHLEYGQLADDSEWPKEIAPDGGRATVECDEAELSVAGCAGWVKYKSASPENPISIYFTFANPIGNVNKIDAGTSEQIYETMTSQFLPVQRVFPTEGSEGRYWTVDACSTDGKTSEARFVIESGDTTEIIPENPQLVNAAATFDSVNAASGRSGNYFTFHPSVYSHFKGVGAFGSKLIFTHTNVLFPHQQGRYMIGNKIQSSGGSATIKATYSTEHNPPWGHPGGVQVCGSYMALTLEKSDKGNTRSEVQIYDVRPTAKNKPMKLLTTIPRDDSGVNGAGMTREKSEEAVGGEKGKYIVIAGDSPGLSVYRSQTTDIIAQTQFDLIQLISKKDLPDTFSPEGGFALATQENGELFIFTMHGTDRSFGLYQLQIEGNHSASVTEVRAPILLETGASSSADAETRYDDTSNAISLADIKARYKPDTDMMSPSEFGANFRWGKGLQITSPTSIEIFATSRNAFPLTTFTGVFSTATWRGYTATDTIWSNSVNYTTGSSVAIATNYNLGCLEMNRGSGGNSNKLYYRVGRAHFSDNHIDFGNGIYFTSSSDFAVSMDNKDHCICVHRESGSGNKLYYAVGLADIGARTVNWGNNQNYTTGTKVAVAMDNHGNCVELHTGSGDDKDNLYYMVGIVNSTAKTIHWGDSYKYDTGADIAIAMDDHGNCVETHRGNPASGNDDKLYYRVGRIDFSKKTVNWGDSIQYDSGSDHSVAMDNSGNCVEVHRGSGSSSNLYYRTGKIQFEKKSIDWSKSKQYDHGSNLAVTMDNNGHCIEVHRHSEGGNDSNKLYYKIGLPDLGPVD